MTELQSILSVLGAELLLHHGHGLLVLLDERARIIEWNTSMEALLAPLEKRSHFTEILVEPSRPIFQRLLNETLAQGTKTQAVLHFAGNEIDLPGSYDCQIIPAQPRRVLLYAHRVPPVDESTAKNFVQLTTALSTANRELRLAKHDLGIKQKELEVSLAKLEQLARTDELTTLPNRREILSQLENETYRAARYRTPLAVMLIDIDHFKFINDRFGHSTGDLALKETARLMQSQVRRTDSVGRYGGEEFLGVLPETTSQPAIQLANRLRECIAHSKIPIADSQSIQLTVSIGVASFQFEHGTPQIILNHADMALYRAKALGRNQTCFWEGSLDETDIG